MLEEDETGDDSYVPQIKPYWKRRNRERLEHEMDVLLAGIAGAVLVALLWFAQYTHHL